MTESAQLIETAYEPYTTEKEHTLFIAATATPGHDADRDEYGRPTECDTATEFEILEIRVDGVLYDGRIDDVFACQFWRYDRTRKTHVRHTVETLIIEIENELSAELWK
jgi:hypothetical protein